MKPMKLKGEFLGGVLDGGGKMRPAGTRWVCVEVSGTTKKILEGRGLWRLESDDGRTLGAVYPRPSFGAKEGVWIADRSMCGGQIIVRESMGEAKKAVEAWIF